MTDDAVEVRIQRPNWEVASRTSLSIFDDDIPEDSIDVVSRALGLSLWEALQAVDMDDPALGEAVAVRALNHLLSTRRFDSNIRTRLRVVTHEYLAERENKQKKKTD